jgi:hypothetical protein
VTIHPSRFISKQTDTNNHEAAEAISQTLTEGWNRAANSNPKMKDEAMKMSGCSKALSLVKLRRRGITFRLGFYELVIGN